MGVEINMVKCKKLEVKSNRGTNTILYGLIVEEEGNLISFKTEKRNYLIHKEEIVAISDTDKEFKGVLN